MDVSATAICLRFKKIAVLESDQRFFNFYDFFSFLLHDSCHFQTKHMGFRKLASFLLKVKEINNGGEVYQAPAGALQNVPARN